MEYSVPRVLLEHLVTSEAFTDKHARLPMTKGPEAGEAALG